MSHAKAKEVRSKIERLGDRLQHRETNTGDVEVFDTTKVESAALADLTWLRANAQHVATIGAHGDGWISLSQSDEWHRCDTKVLKSAVGITD